MSESVTMKQPGSDTPAVSLPRLYKGLIQRHWVVAALVAILLAGVLSEAFWFGKLPQHLAYLAALTSSVVVVDLIYWGRRVPDTLFRHARPYFSPRQPSWTPALMNCLNLVPLGLLWGYVMHRTQSLFPSMVLHMFKLSGLHNF